MVKWIDDTQSKENLCVILWFQGDSLHLRVDIFTQLCLSSAVLPTFHMSLTTKIMKIADNLLNIKVKYDLTVSTLGGSTYFIHSQWQMMSFLGFSQIFTATAVFVAIRISHSICMHQVSCGPSCHSKTTICRENQSNSFVSIAQFSNFPLKLFVHIDFISVDWLKIFHFPFNILDFPSISSKPIHIYDSTKQRNQQRFLCQQSTPIFSMIIGYFCSQKYGHVNITFTQRFSMLGHASEP